MISLIDIDRDNIDDLVQLSVAPGQEEIIAPNDEWLAEAVNMPECRNFGISWNGETVGLATLVDPELASEDDAETFQPGCCFLWRIMIDQRFQGRGFGARALALIMKRVEQDGFSGLSLATTDRMEGNAIPFYLKQGFEPTGRRLDDEIELIKYVDKRPRAGRDLGRA